MNLDTHCTRLQSPSENRTVVGFRIRFYASPGHLISGPFENRTKKSGFRMASLDRFIKKRVIKKYFIRDKTV
jgi:hypothetical protein